MSDYVQLSDFRATGAVTLDDLIYSQNVTSGIEQKTTVRQLQNFLLGSFAPTRQSVPVLAAGQTTYLTSGYTPGLVNVFVAGIRLNPSQYQAVDSLNIIILDAKVLAKLVVGMTVDIDAVLSTAVADVATVGSVNALMPANQPVAAALTGAELTSVTQSGGLFQTTLTTIATWALQAFKGFTQPSTGAVPRTVLSKLQDVVSVKDFGADSTGSTDCTAAIQAALNTGQNVYLPPGVYAISTTLYMTVGQMVFGAGRSLTTISATGNINVFQLATGAGGGIREMSIVYPTPATGGNAIVGLTSMSLDIGNLFIQNCYNGIQLGNSQASRVSHVEIWYFTNYGLYVNNNANDIFFESCFLNGAVSGTSTAGVANTGLYFSGKAQAIMCSKLEIIQCFRPADFEGASLSTVSIPSFCQFTDCYFDSSSNDVRLNYTRGMYFKGCWFSQRAQGCTVQNALDTTFDTCQFVNNNQHGLVINTGAVYTRVINCIFDSNSQASSGASWGIVIAANVSDWQVIGGTFGNLGVFPAFQAGGILILAGTSTRWLITNAQFVTGSASINDSSTGTEKHISHCIGYITMAKGTAVIPIGQLVCSINHGLPQTPNPQDINVWAISNPTASGADGVWLPASAITATTFQIAASMSGTVTGVGLSVAWEARIAGE